MREGRARFAYSEGPCMYDGWSGRNSIHYVYDQGPVPDKRVSGWSVGGPSGSSSRDRRVVSSEEQQRRWKFKYAKYSLPVYASIAIAVFLTVFIVSIYRG